jgi:SAM-dependent methyltransferase
VDISPAMLALARKHVKGARFIEASLYDVDAWSRARQSFDAVLAVGEPLSYFAPRGRAPSLARFFRDIARVLRPDGAFVFDVIVAGKPSLTRRSFVEGDGWTTCVSTSDEGARLTREITTFTRQRASEWKRGHETHVVRVLDVDDVKRDLARAGFTVRVRKSYGDHPLAVRRRAFLCRRA